MDILFEDNHLLFVSKPAGVVTQDTEGHAESLEGLAKLYIKRAMNKPGNVFLHAVHRLDTPTSGIVLFAKTSKALSRLQEALRNHLFEKSYIAIVHGKLSSRSKVLEHWLVHGEKLAFVSTKDNKEAKRAILEYELLQEIEGNSLVRVRLKTGRYHQIRAQFSAIGHPVIGDSKYGSATWFHQGAIALHHVEMKLVHPVTKEELCVAASLPPFWPRVLHL
jgi:23S rRNA pseudouridine1911/1915/1917 synthase